MQFLSLPFIFASALVSIAPASALSNQKLANYCNKPLYVQYNGSGENVGPLTVAPKSSVTFNITGSGNTLQVARSAYFGGSTPRMSFGTSTTNGQLYWAVNDINGDPFMGAKWNVSSYGPGATGVCSSTTMYSSTAVYSCPDNNVLLEIFGCAGLA